MRVLVCGGREFHDYSFLERCLNYLHKENRFTALIHGDARGADRMAKAWAGARRIPAYGYPARWTTDGKAAGPLRNQRMLDEGKPDLVVAFEGGTGTEDMVRRARKAGVKVVRPVPKRAVVSHETAVGDTQPA